MNKGIIASTIWHEARGEGREGMLAVASVIWNRAQRDGKSLNAVCLAPKQFSCNNSGFTLAAPTNEREADILAFLEGIESQMLAGTFQPTTNATHYHTLNVMPNWSAGMTDKKIIGKHLFGVTT